jgi:hypothetical protein
MTIRDSAFQNSPFVEADHASFRFIASRFLASLIMASPIVLLTRGGRDMRLMNKILVSGVLAAALAGAVLAPSTGFSQQAGGAGWSIFDVVRGGSAAPAGATAAVSRIPGSMEVFWIGNNGSVKHAFWYEGGGPDWGNGEIAPAGSAATGGGIAAVSRIPGSMEIWWIGGNGSVQGAFWYDGGQWSRYEVAPAGSASTTGGIAAVSRIENHMEVWWIGANGSVWDAFWYDGGQWQRFELAPAGSAAANSKIAAVSRIPGSMEVWWVAPNGSVQDKFWYEPGWGGFELAPAGSAAPEGGIAAVSRIPGSMEVFFVAPNGSVQDKFWYEGGGPDWGGFELAPAGSAAPAGDIAAVSRIPGSLEVFWIAPNGSVQDKFWYEGGGPDWGGFELAPAGTAAPTGDIAAVSRIPGSMEIWWIGGDGSIKDAFWYETAAAVVPPPDPVTPPPPNPVTPPPPNNAARVTVVQAVDVYDNRNFDGNPIGVLEQGTQGVTLLEPCNDSRCHVTWPNGTGWVYDGPDYNSLEIG